MATKYKASIIIPTKNAGSVFFKVFDSVCNQKTGFSYEVLVIDSGSTDGTVEYVKEKLCEHIRFHQISPTEFGHGKTRNLGVSLTTGEYAVLITHDACPVSDNWLENLVRMADRDDEIAGVFGRHIAYPHSSPFTAKELEAHFAMFAGEPVVMLDDNERYRNDERYRQYLHFFSDNNALIRRSVWKKIPYPDVDFAEDQIWAQSVLEAGYKKAYAHDAVVYHSHDFTLFERLQRSFDESYALRRLFGYVLCRDPFSLIRTWALLSGRDVRYVMSIGLWKKHPLDIIRRPVDNLMKLTGHYLGGRGDQLPDGMKRFLSRDKRMMLGIPMGSDKGN